MIHNDSPVLPYGQQIAFGPFTCTSEMSGVTCTNQGGHGFTLRRAAQQVF
nr:DUF6636 domain-containing protein [Wenxinia marina]